MTNYRKFTQINIKTTKLFPFLMAIIAIMSGWAALSGDSTLSSDVFKVYGLYIFNFCLLILIVFVLTRRIRPYLGIIISSLIFGAFEYIHIYENGKQTIGLSMIILLVLFGIISDIDREAVFFFYKKLLLIMAVLAIICYVAFLFSVPIPHNVVEYYAHTGVYIDYKVSYLLSAGPLTRACGLFNEPGYFGTILALVLCANNLDIKKKENIVFLIAGILSFSVAFFVIVLVYLVFKSFKNIKIAVLLALGIVLIPTILSYYSSISMDSNATYLFSRIFNFSTAIQDRSYSTLERMVEQWLHSDKLLFGYGSGYASGTGSSSYKILLVRYGILGFVAIYGSLIIAALKKAKKNFFAIVFIICFVINIYQRPFVFTLPYFIILFGGIEMVKNIDNCKENSEDR